LGEEPFLIEENVRGGVAYLARLMRRVQGDLRLVTAAYFAGENRIAASWLSYQSPEVYGYVSRVAKVYRKEAAGGATLRPVTGRV